jgi:membrane-associated phospholipid phosphatase
MNEFLLIDEKDWLITFLASFLVWVMFGGLLVLWIVDGRIKKEQALHALIAAAAAWIVAEIVKNLIPSIRPFQIYGYSPLTLTIPNGNSFPSSHAAAVFGMAFSVLFHEKKLGIIFTIGALLVGLGRILAHVHYAFDIFGGALIAFVVAMLLQKLHVGKLLSASRKKGKP